MISAGKHSVLGVAVDVIDYEAAVARILAASHEERPFGVSALAVHGVMTGVQDPEHLARLNDLEIVTPDGQPVRWALNLLHQCRLRERVYGPDLTWLLLSRSVEQRIPVFFYGSTEEVLESLISRLESRLPDLLIAGAEPSKFRDIDSREAAALARRMRNSGARLIFVGLGCPRQEAFIWYMRGLVRLPMVAVGAAFDYHAGLLRKPPALMQRFGLEWLWRFGIEPRRLWRRYVLLNPAFVFRLLGQRLRLWNPPVPEPTLLERIPG